MEVEFYKICCPHGLLGRCADLESPLELFLWRDWKNNGLLSDLAACPENESESMSAICRRNYVQIHGCVAEFAREELYWCVRVTFLLKERTWWTEALKVLLKGKFCRYVHLRRRLVQSTFEDEGLGQMFFFILGGILSTSSNSIWLDLKSILVLNRRKLSLRVV